MPTFDIEVYRDSYWWMIRVPALAGYTTPDGTINIGDTTQARSESEIDATARDFIALVLNIPTETVCLRRGR